MAFFPANYGESRAFYANATDSNRTPSLKQPSSPRSSNEGRNEGRNEEHTQTWRDVPGLDDIHKQERMKDAERHQIYLMKENEMKKKQAEKQRYMTAHVERLERQNPGPAIDVPPQSEPSRAQDPTINRPGIGLLGEGEKSDYDVYDTDFHGGKKKSRTKRKKSRTKKMKSRTKKRKSKTKKIKSISKKMKSKRR